MTAVAAAVVVEEEVVVVTIAIGKLSIYAYTYMIWYFNVICSCSYLIHLLLFADRVRARSRLDHVVVAHQHIRQCVVNPIPGLAHALITKL